MAASDQLVRQWGILHALSQRREGQTAAQLAKRFGVSKNTIVRDLDTLSASGFTVHHVEEGNRHVYKLSDGIRKLSQIRPTELDGLTPIDVKELPAELWQAAQHPILLSYKYLKHPYRLVLDVKRHEDVPVLASTIDAAWVTTFQTKEGKLLHSALLQVKNTHKQFVELTRTF